MGIVRPTLLVLLFAAPATCFLTPALLTARSGLHPVDAALAPRLGRSSGIPRQGKEALRCAVGPESERDAGEATAAGHRWSGATGGVQGRRALMRSVLPFPHRQLANLCLVTAWARSCLFANKVTSRLCAGARWLPDWRWRPRRQRWRTWS